MKFAASLLVFAISFNQSPLKKENPVNSLPAVRTIESYKEELTFIRNWVVNLQSEDYYDKNFKFKHRETNEEKKFSEMLEFDKAVFYLMIAEQLSHKLLAVNKAWQELHDDADDKNSPTKNEFAGLINELLTLRKETAVKWETIAEQTFKQYPSKFANKETDTQMRQIRSWNDTHRLIERKK